MQIALLFVTIAARCINTASTLHNYNDIGEPMKYEDEMQLQNWQIGDDPVHDWDLIDSHNEYNVDSWNNVPSDDISLNTSNSETPPNEDLVILDHQDHDSTCLVDEAAEAYDSNEGFLFPMSSLIMEEPQKMEVPSSKESEETIRRESGGPRRRIRGKTMRRKYKGKEVEHEIKIVGDVRTVQKMQPTEYVRSLGPDWIKFIPIYEDVDGEVTRHTARYRIFSRLTFDIARGLTSRDFEKEKAACAALANDRRKKIHIIENRPELQRRLQEHFAFKHPKTATNIARNGLPDYPKNRLHELESKEKGIYIPALQLLQRLANQKCYDQNKNCPSRNAVIDADNYPFESHLSHGINHDWLSIEDLDTSTTNLQPFESNNYIFESLDENYDNLEWLSSQLETTGSDVPELPIPFQTGHLQSSWSAGEGSSSVPMVSGHSQCIEEDKSDHKDVHQMLEEGKLKQKELSRRRKLLSRGYWSSIDIDERKILLSLYEALSGGTRNFCSEHLRMHCDKDIRDALLSDNSSSQWDAVKKLGLYQSRNFYMPRASKALSKEQKETLYLYIMRKHSLQYNTARGIVSDGLKGLKVERRDELAHAKMTTDEDLEDLFHELYPAHLEVQREKNSRRKPRKNNQKDNLPTHGQDT